MKMLFFNAVYRLVVGFRGQSEKRASAGVGIETTRVRDVVVADAFVPIGDRNEA